MLKESRLSELMDTEQMLYRQIQTLDSEMQTLIYENYNKFISATDTVRKVRLEPRNQILNVRILDERSLWQNGTRIKFTLTKYGIDYE